MASARRRCAAAPPRPASAACAAPARRSRPAARTAVATASRPPHRPAWGAGSHRQARPLRRQTHATSAPASHANIVMCRPLMLIRWATPESRNRSQSARAIAAWSPTVSAASTPPSRASATRSTTASRSAWRVRSIGRRSCLVQQRRPRAGERAAHGAGGADLLLEQPQLAIEAVRVHRAVRAPQAHRHLPALAGPQVGPQPVDPAVVGQAVQPHQRHARRHAARAELIVECTVDGQHEAHALGRHLRHLVDHADEQQIAPFERRCELLGQTVAGAQAGDAECRARQRDAQQQRVPAGRAPHRDRTARARPSSSTADWTHAGHNAPAAAAARCRPARPAARRPIAAPGRHALPASTGV